MRCTDDGRYSRTGMPCARRCRFSSRHARFGVVKDRRGQRGVGVAAREDVGEVLERAGAARGDHRDVHRVGRPPPSSRSRSRRLRAVAIDRRQQDLAGAARLGLARPLDGVARGVGRAAAHVDREAVVAPLGVDRDDHRLAAVALRERRDQRRDCVSAAVFRLTLSAPASIAAAASSSERMPPPTVSGRKISRATASIVSRERLAALERRGDVEDRRPRRCLRRCSAAPAPPDRRRRAAPGTARP